MLALFRKTRLLINLFEVPSLNGKCVSILCVLFGKYCDFFLYGDGESKSKKIFTLLSIAFFVPILMSNRLINVVSIVHKRVEELQKLRKVTRIPISFVQIMLTILAKFIIRLNAQRFMK